MCCFQLQVLSKFKETSVVLAGDGRCDSPGKSAKFCTYSMIEKDKNLILHFEVMDKREVSLKSPNMEREAMVRALNFLMQHLTIKELITDASTSVHKTLGNYVLYGSFVIKLMTCCIHSYPVSINTSLV